ncbi:MAG: hypothetical protein OXC91_02110 [Rhodobacteraceae bacterium]|nr:hypothetical protein [Paracoccaceae bacterium]
MLGTALDHAVEAPQIILIRLCKFKIVKYIKNRFVIRLHQNHDPLASRVVKVVQQSSQSQRSAVTRAFRHEPVTALNTLQLHENTTFDLCRAGVSPAKAHAQHRMWWSSPVPVGVNVQPPEQCLDRVQKKAFAEAPGMGEEVVVPRSIRSRMNGVLST